MNNEKQNNSTAPYNRERPANWAFNQTSPHRMFTPITQDDRDKAWEKLLNVMNDAREKVGEFSQLT